MCLLEVDIQTNLEDKLGISKEAALFIDLPT